MRKWKFTKAEAKEQKGRLCNRPFLFLDVKCTSNLFDLLNKIF